jgi:programmed cell death 6-interacting protein
LKSANSSDELVKKKLKDSEAVLEILQGTDRDIENYVPSSRKATMPPKVEQEARKLRSLLNEVGRLESRRKRKIEEVRAKAKADDIREQSFQAFYPFL